MKLYKISMDGDFGSCDGRSLWTSRKSDIPRLKRELRDACGDAAAQPDPTVEEIEFAPSVDGIVRMLNIHADRG
jgi:hypothetical protein